MTEEEFENQSNRLIEAEGQIFALTRLISEILPMVADPQAVNLRLKQMQAVCVPKDDADKDWVKFIQAANALFGRMIKGEPPAPPTFTVIRGGKSEAD